MVIEKLELSDYRNYKNLYLELNPKTNILYGDNAQGKTNILESIYVCSTTKSHRGSKDREIIKIDKEESHIKLVINKKGFNYRIDMHLKKNKPKGIAVNGVPIKKSSEIFGILNVVFFSPEDLLIIKNGPSERRKFIDIELCQLDKIYVSNLIKYNKALIQRNKLLKEIIFRNDYEEMLDVWDMQIAEYGEKIMKRRKKFVEEINELIREIHKDITDGKECLSVVYENNVEEENFYETLIRNREKDIKFKVTNAGPHRDDIGFYIGNLNVKTYGSQGQQRTAALSLKLAEIELVKKIINDTPVLLLDDVLSELDKKRQNNLINCLEGVQTIITCTGLDEFVENMTGINKIYKVTNGKILTEDNLLNI